MIVTLKDIADIVGVHPSTVSRVLRNKETDIQTSRGKRAQILRLAKELNYQPNQMARSFRLKKSQLIGYIVPDIADAFYAYSAKILEHKAAEYDLSMIICNTDGNSEKEKIYIRKLYAQSADGIIIAPSSDMTKSLSDLKKYKIPYVVINSRKRTNPIDIVNIKNYNAAYKTLRSILNSGKKKIAFLGTSVNSEFYNAFVDVHRKMGLELSEELICLTEATLKNGYMFAEQLVGKRYDIDEMIITDEILAGGIKAFLQDIKYLNGFHITLFSSDDPENRTFFIMGENVFSKKQYIADIFAELTGKMGLNTKKSVKPQRKFASVAV